MLLSKFVYTSTSSRNYRYLKDLGYPVTLGGRRGGAKGERVKINVHHLQSNSNLNVACRCDDCGKKYIQRFSRNKDVCYPCRKVKQMLGNSLGRINKGKKNPNQTGPLHPRWNPNKPEFISYGTRARWLSELTYRTHKTIINPHDHPRTLCGVEDGYQLDHIVSIKKAYTLGWTPEQCADIGNLQLLPWADNRRKWK